MNTAAVGTNRDDLDALKKVLQANSDSIKEKARACLADQPSPKEADDKKTLRVEKEYVDIPFLMRLLENDCLVQPDMIACFAAKVRRVDYDMTDMFTEITCLCSAVDDVVLTKGKPSEQSLKALFGLSSLRCALSDLCRQVYEATLLFYERSITEGVTGYCQLDLEGRIVFCNAQFKRLAETKNPEGTLLTDYLKGGEKEVIETIFDQTSERQSFIQACSWISRKKTTKPLGLEVACVSIADRYEGYYARLTDLTEPMKMQNRMFDKIKLGIVRLDENKRIAYTNESFRDLLGLDCKQWEGMDFEELVPDEKNRLILEKQLSMRFEGVSDEYDIDLFRMDDQRTIPVRIAATPVMDLQGKVGGTLAIIRCIVKETIQAHIEKETTVESLLTTVMEDLNAAVPFDSVSVALFSAGMTHARSFFTYPPEENIQQDRRWWAMTTGMKAWVGKKIKPVPDIEEFYDKPEFKHLKEEPDIQYILSRYKSFLYYPIIKEGHVQACVVMYSESNKPYGDSHRRLLRSLPLDAAVLTALHYDEKKNLEFVIELLKGISELKHKDDLIEIAHYLTDAIAKQYKWENVTIFSVDRNENEFVLLSQKTSSENYRIPTDYRQSVNKGILGQAYMHNKVINAKDVHAEEWENLYVKTVEVTRSELCIPIISGDLYWLLNIEDAAYDAFSDAEISALEELIDKIAIFLERAWLRYFKEKSMQKTSDAVIQITRQGKIVFANKAANNLLGYDDNELMQKHLKDILDKKESADLIISAQKLPNASVSFRRKNGQEIKLLMSKFKLHKEYSTSIIVAKDLTLQENIEELSWLKALFYEIALQTKTPLTLLFSWLRRMKERDESVDVEKTADKALKQLRKLELSFDRLALYRRSPELSSGLPSNKILFRIREVWQLISEHLTKADLERIAYKAPRQDACMFGDPYQVVFCLETILSYLLRAPGLKGDIEFTVDVRGQKIHLNIKGEVPKLVTNGSLTENQFFDARTLFNMALGENVITQFVNQNSGQYSKSELKKNSIHFKIIFPLDKE